MENIISYIIGIGAIVAMMLAWVGVQSLWRNTFSENISDEDVLAERRSCGNCGCTKVCKKEKSR
ncbi:hypothetical protein [Cecembia rubra]|uniref:Uncharacterized protein n=1 Tax=Cecembia rubra TaxID=1485585 RepID=A0A2P8DWX6_9BACT|nr:hypothetical protein [Cecembia rubra]PSL01704.1 hypothetical protein CLV48_11247 [Cecembia rubra]